MSPFNPQTLKGFRDFLPQEKRRRDFILNKITPVFTSFGFEPLETPTLEYAEVILGKYGAEADKLVYQFLDRGGRSVALRYDQTVPTARVLAQYRASLPKFFRRFQIQNVYRADKPQKGRFREFTQCDIDIFGSTSPVTDAEIVACTYFAFQNIGYPRIILNLNDRQILFDILSGYSTASVPVLSIIQTIDKLDKKTPAAVLAELTAKGLKTTAAAKTLSAIQQAKPSPNLNEITSAARSLGVPQTSLKFAPTLARGLDYYTGMIFEVVLPDYPVGSFGGGGRYDKLIEQLGGPATPAVGIAFGFDRMVEAADGLKLIPPVASGAQVLVTIFDKTTQEVSLKAAATLRRHRISTEVYPQADKLGLQIKLADQKHIPYVLIIGAQEAHSQKVTLKHLSSGQQQTLTLDQALTTISSQ